MKPLRRRSPGRTAMMLTLIALLATVCVSVYLYLSHALGRDGGSSAPGAITGDNLRVELTILLAVLLGSILLILIFVIGSYLLMRVGRAVSQKRVGGKPTEYEDAWSRYRLSDEEIEAATREQHPDEPEHDDWPEPSGDDPENPDSKG